jgi:2-polyprenyl-3-methyl-5-hydroxy-6-metoxy-1,4-benzoquinol methylase
MAEKNTPELWDKVWQQAPTTEQDIFTRVKEENSIRWARIEAVILKEFGSFEGLKVIEIGAGSGTYAALMAKRGAKLTVMDYSEKALKQSEDFFKRNGLKAELVKQDALAIAPEFAGKYDVSMSFGLTEHFLGADRVNIHKTHFDVLRKGGVAFISVPNKYSLPYRLYKFAAEVTGKWKVGEEYPFSRKELAGICRQIGVTDFSIFGDSLAGSFNLINPVSITRKLFKLKGNTDVACIKKEKGCCLDQYLSYALVLCGKK